MSKFVPQEYPENIHRLALGIDPVDFTRGRGLMHPVRIDIERTLPHPGQRPEAPYCHPLSPGRKPDRLCRHPSGRYALLYFPGIGTHINLRIYDHNRWYVPRRLRVPLLTLEQLEQPENSLPSLRRREPVLFPGAAYDISCTATGLRGRVLRDDKIMRWAYIKAALPEDGPVVGRARSDDRGEFLLLLSPEAAPANELTRTIRVEIAVSGPAVAPVPGTDDTVSDRLWDLPVEVLPDPGEADEVSSGISLPDNYVTASGVRLVDFELGRILTGIEVTPLEFTLP